MQEAVVLKKPHTEAKRVGVIPLVRRTRKYDSDDEWLCALVEKRLKNDSGRHISYEEILAKRGLTLADIAAMEDVEIE